MVADFSKKRNREFFTEKLLFQTLGVVFLIVIVVLIVSDIKIYQKKKDLTAQINTYQKRIDDIKKSSQTIKDEIANADNPDYLEKIAYEQLGEQKPGEQQIIFVKPQEKQKLAVTQQNPLTGFESWFSGAWNWLKSKF